MATLGLGTGLGRVRSARAFHPQSIPGIMAWYDATDASSITQSSGLVTQWNDKSGNARHVGNSGSARPSMGSGCVTFNGSSQHLYNTAPCLYAAQTYAIYMVIEGSASNYGAVVCEASSSTGCVFAPVMTGNGGSNAALVPYIVQDSGATIRSNLSLGATLHNGTKRLIRVCEKNSLLTAYANGTLAASPTSHTRGASLTPNRFSIGAFMGSWTGYYGNFKLYELIIVANDASGQQVEGYLAHKHGIASLLPSGHRYKNAPPKKGQSTSYPVETKTTGTMTAALLGDSITAVNMGNPTGQALYYGADGYFTTYAALSNQRVYLPTPNNKGVSGDSSGQVLSRIGDLSSLTFDRCFVLVGTNDISNGTGFDTIRDNIDWILNYITITLNKVAVIMTILPRVHGSDVTNRKARLNAINSFIMNSHGSREGRVLSVNIYNDFNNGSDEPITSATTDGLHPNAYGAMVMGRSIHTRLSSFYGSGAHDFTTGNLLSNPTLSGTGGTASTHVSGNVATGYTALGENGSGGRTASKNGDGSQRLSMAVTGGSSSDKLRLSQTVTTGYASGDTVYAMALVEFVGTPTNITRSALELRLPSPASQTLASTLGLHGGGTPVAETYMAPGRYLIRTPNLPLTSTPLSLEWRYEMTGNSSSTPNSGAVNILAAGIFKL